MFIFDPNHTVTSILYVCPICEMKTFNGGPAYHYRGCTETGYDTCNMVIGPETIKSLLGTARYFKNEKMVSLLLGISLNNVRQQLPEVIKIYEKEEKNHE